MDWSQLFFLPPFVSAKKFASVKYSTDFLELLIVEIELSQVEHSNRINRVHYKTNIKQVAKTALTFKKYSKG